MPIDTRLSAGRRAIETYRRAHYVLHQANKDRSVHDAHNPLLKSLLENLLDAGFNTLEEFFKANAAYVYQETGYLDTESVKQAHYLSITDNLAQGRSYHIQRDQDQDGWIFDTLAINGQVEMSSRKSQLAATYNACKKCPANSRVFIGGLGLGLDLLFLGELGLTTDITVGEISEEFVNLAWDDIRARVNQIYPSLMLSVVLGDAYNEVFNQGLFDWIYFDIDQDTDQALAYTISPALTSRGVYTYYENIVTDWW